MLKYTTVIDWLTFQDMNEMSGSRGEANFVWKCKNCKVFLPSNFIFEIFC